MALEPGKNVLHFRILEKIGEGGMGEVQRAPDTRLDRDVPIKVMSTETLGDEERRVRSGSRSLWLGLTVTSDPELPASPGMWARQRASGAIHATRARPA